MPTQYIYHKIRNLAKYILTLKHDNEYLLGVYMNMVLLAQFLGANVTRPRI